MISRIRASFSKDWMGNAVKSVTLWASRQNGLLMPWLIVAYALCTTLADHPDTQLILQTTCLCPRCKAKVKVAALWQTAYSVKAWQISALLSVSLSLGLSRAINIFHWCLVRSGPFTGTARFLASLFTFLSRWPTGSELVKRTGSKQSSWLQKNQVRVFCTIVLICEMLSVPYANEQRKISDVALTDLVQCHPPDKVDMTICSNNWFTPNPHAEIEQERLLKNFK